MGGSSKSSTSSSTSTTTNNASNESGVQVVGSSGVSIVSTDHDAVKLSFAAMEELSTDAFDFAGDAMSSVGDANERIEHINTETIGTLKDFAETLKTGDLKTTKTIYLAGIGIVGAIVIAAIVTSQNKKKASK